MFKRNINWAGLIAFLLCFLLLEMTAYLISNPAIPIGDGTIDEAQHIHQWNHGVCSVCGAVCEHNFENGICTNCGMKCQHQYNKDGICSICGIECEHQYENGVCTICGKKCKHEKHDQDQICLSCGMKVTHNFQNGQCVICGAKPLIYDHLISEKWLKPNERKGNLEHQSFINEEDQPRDLFVYTPYGYNEDNQYNVIVMLHGDGGSMNDWADRAHKWNEIKWNMNDVYDNMIDEKICEPFILVSIEYQRWKNAYNAPMIAEAIKTELMPWIAENYATYAKSGQYDDLVAARDHVAIGGIGRGADFIYRAILPGCLDISSNFMMFSNETYEEDILPNIQTSVEQYPIHFIYTAAGSGETRYHTELMYKELIENIPSIQKDVNIRYDVINKQGHSWGNWTTSFFNAMQFMF